MPPYNCDLNPIEYIWHLVKQRVAQKNVQQRENEIEAITLEALASITENDWKKEVDHVKRIENDYWQRECLEIPRNEVVVTIGRYSSKLFLCRGVILSQSKGERMHR